MHQRRWLFLVGFVLLCLVGCGESPKLILRDAITHENEILDCLNKIPDNEGAEDAAEEYVKKKAPLFKKRADHLKKRFDDTTLNADKDMKQAMKDALKYWEEEGEAIGKRKEFELARLRKIMLRIAEAEAEKLRSPPNLFAEVGNKAALGARVQMFQVQGKRLIIVEPETVAPKLAAAIKEAFEKK